ncbi:MAG TPA: HEAT repeat domain-containing protein [Luteolibacter sp.]|nr:HEAT repeat domain-containing protein [Luteolibacter sp.]
MYRKTLFVKTLSSAACLLIVACQKKDTTRAGKESTQPGENGVVSYQAVPANSPFRDALAAVNAKAPQTYPALVTALPERKDFEKTDTSTLLSMLESWNPALRQEASKALSARGGEVLGTLKQGLQSDNWMVRAGSVSALADIVKTSLEGLKGDALQAALDKHADVTSQFAKLAYDERLEVRIAALQGLNTTAPQTPEAVKAVLHLCNDPDDYLSQDAMVTLKKRFRVDSLEQNEVITAFKSALGRELPNGKGQIVHLITLMKPEAQRQFIPDLLAFLDWKIMRDTMFADSGQEAAIKLLTQMKETQLIPRLPGLMNKINRGDGLFIPCLTAARAFGKDAKVILPQLKDILADIEKNGNKAKIRPNKNPEAAIQELKKTIEHLESL